MFYAAQAALLLSGDATSATELGKTHRGLISRFSMKLVKHGPLPVEMGSHLHKAEKVRLVADYRMNDLGTFDAEEMVGHAERFIDTIRSTYGSADAK